MERKFNFRDWEIIFKEDKQYEFLNKLATENFELFTTWIKQLFNDKNPSPLYLHRQSRDLGGPYTHYIYGFYDHDKNNKRFRDNLKNAIIQLIEEYDPLFDNDDYFAYLLELSGYLGDGIKSVKSDLIRIGNNLGDILVTKEGDSENLLERLARVLWGFGFDSDIDTFMKTIEGKYSTEGIRQIVNAYNKDKVGEKWY